MHFTGGLQYKYDKLYRLKGETVLDYTGNIERSVTYEYDKFGNRLSMKVANADGHLEVTYTYNERDQLTTETRVFDQVSEVTFKPDGSYYVHAPPRPSVWSGRLLLSFASLALTCLLAPFVFLKTNRAGKRARRNRRFIAAISAFMTPMFIITPDALAYLHNDAMWYSAVASGAVGLPGPTTTTITYTYDNSGNLVTKEEDNGLITSTVDYVYDAENHLIQFDPHNGPQTITSYTYDADGIRLSKTKAGETTYYTTDKNRPYAQVLEERDKDGNLLIQYAYGHDLISQTRTPDSPTEQVRYFHYDGQMSTRLITEGTENATFTGWITDKITYDAFGQITDRQDYGNPTNTKYLYTGEQYDNDLGQYYLRARYYDHSIGRFTTKDSFEGSEFDPHSLHRYLYANSNPVRFGDPTGMFTQRFGYLAEAAISRVYAREHPGDTVSYGAWARLGGIRSVAYRLKPDILNHTKQMKTWLEIKPLSVSGVAKGGAQYATYLLTFLPFGYRPEYDWDPKDNIVLAGKTEIVFFNAGGIVFYTDAIDCAEDLAAITTVAAARTYLAKKAAQRIAQSIVGVMGKGIGAMARTRVRIDMARFRGHLSIASIFASVGVL